jgi:hypothetical protein
MGMDGGNDNIWPECVELGDMSMQVNGYFKTVDVCR